MIQKINSEGFDEAIKSAEKVIIEFYANWCGPCKVMKPILNKISETGIAVFEVDVEDQPELTDKYEVQSIPTTLYFENGIQISKTIGARSENKVLSEFNHDDIEDTSTKG